MQRLEHMSHLEWPPQDHDELCLRERLIFLASEFAASDQQFTYLELRTGISAARWEALFSKDAEPSLDMIMAIARHRRNKIEWLITGHVAKFMPQKKPKEALIYSANLTHIGALT